MGLGRIVGGGLLRNFFERERESLFSRQDKVEWLGDLTS